MPGVPASRASMVSRAVAPDHLREGMNPSKAEVAWSDSTVYADVEDCYLLAYFAVKAG
jgi:hypothetical protein